MSKKKDAASYRTTRNTVTDDGRILHIERDADGEYKITNEEEEITLYIGFTDGANSLYQALENLLEQNDELGA